MLVGDAQDFEIDARTAFGEELAHGRTEAAGDDVLFDCHEPRDTGGEREDPLLVERLREACVHDRRLEPVASQDLGGFHGRRDRMAIRQDRDAVTLAKGLGFADRDLCKLGVEGHACACAAWESDAHRAAARGRVAVCGPDHLAKLGFVLRCHECHAGEDS